MKNTFLDKVVKAVIEFPLNETLVIFPTRRACLFFSEELSKQLQNVTRLPAIIPVKDLPQKLRAFPVADDPTLLIELFHTYDQQFNSGNLDSFLNWGEQLLDDFNEVDRQMISAHQLFEKVIDIKSIEATFQSDEDDLERINNFWNQFSSQSITPLRERFLGYWEMLPLLYSAYKKKLEGKGIAYEGMAWRQAAETINNNSYFNQFKKVVFAGFYSLTQSEEVIMQHLEKENKLVLFRDADEWYIEKKYREAGRYFRKGLLSKADIPWTESLLNTSSKNISVCGVSGRSSMARELALTVDADLKGKPLEVYSRSVIVLPDDSLLFPLLDHCATLGIPVNPSMGFPLAHHPVLQLLQSIRILRKKLSETASGWLIAENLRWAKDHPILSQILTDEDEKQLNRFINNNEIEEKILPVAALLSQIPLTVAEEQKLLRNFLTKININTIDALEGLKEVILQESEILWDALLPFKDILSTSSWWKLYLSDLEKKRVPFKSNKDGGIQVMGFLETRILDYEYVFIASMNEGILPSDNTSTSMIPYAVRKAYQLPCREEQDAVTAYHFYRLLQRASTIRFFYNSDIDDMGGGEKSRFLYQLHHELEKTNPGLKFNYSQVENIPGSPSSHEIKIQKTEAIINALKRKFVENAEIKKSGLSASAINSYISCSLKFYLEQVAGLREDEVHDSIDASVFGNIFHDCMHHLYKDRIDLNDDLIQQLLKSVPEKVDEAISTNFREGALAGNDYLMRGVIIELVKAVLKNDLTELPLQIIQLETEFRSTINVPQTGKILLKGFIDRIDQQKEYLRIIDYKTGKDELKLPAEFDNLFTDSKYKAALQLLFYVLLYSKNSGNNQIKAGLFRLRHTGEGISYLNNGESVSNEQLQNFENGLTKLIAEIFNPQIPFTQTDEKDRCVFCSFNGICTRVEN